MTVSILRKKLTIGPSAIAAQVEDWYDLNVLIKYHRRYGDLFTIPSQERGKSIVVVSKPEFVKHILSTHFKKYKKGIGFDRVELLLGNGLIVSDGPVWHRHRRMIQPSFHHTKLAKFEKLMQHHNQVLLQKWQHAYQHKKTINLTADMSAMTLDVVLGTIFSEDVARLHDMHGSNPFDFIKEDQARNLEFAKKFRELTKLIGRVIEYRLQSGRRPFDFLSQFIDARDRKDNKGMNIKEITNEVTTLIIAGHETTASALQWAWYLLSKNPEIEVQFHQEIDRALSGRIASFADLQHLQFTKQIIQETMRLYPPVWLITRRALVEDEIGEYIIPAGTDILISPYIIHRLKSFWPKPEQFIPHRFNDENLRLRDRFAYLPFSVGPRKCIGDYISICEMQMHLSFIGQSFKLRQATNQQPVMLEAKVNLRSKYPLHMQLQLRDNVN